jgi:hypothetical protein
VGLCVCVVEQCIGFAMRGAAMWLIGTGMNSVIMVMSTALCVFASISVDIQWVFHAIIKIGFHMQFQWFNVICVGRRRRRVLHLF